MRRSIGPGLDRERGAGSHEGARRSSSRRRPERDSRSRTHERELDQLSLRQHRLGLRPERARPHHPDDGLDPNRDHRSDLRGAPGVWRHRLRRDRRQLPVRTGRQQQRRRAVEHAALDAHEFERPPMRKHLSARGHHRHPGDRPSAQSDLPGRHGEHPALRAVGRQPHDARARRQRDRRPGIHRACPGRGRARRHSNQPGRGLHPLRRPLCRLLDVPRTGAGHPRNRRRAALLLRHRRQQVRHLGARRHVDRRLRQRVRGHRQRQPSRQRERVRTQPRPDDQVPLDPRQPGGPRRQRHRCRLDQPGAGGGGDVIQGGKSGDSVLLDSTMGQRQLTHVCGENLGATGYFAPYIYMPCQGGLYAYTQSGNTFSTTWNTTFNSGPPIIAGGAVFVLDVSAGTLHALNPATGAPITSVSTGGVGHFATPAAGDGMIFVGATTQVVAFSLNGVPPVTCTSASMSPGAASPQAPGATVTFTASATTCTAAQFKFFLQQPVGSWTAQTAFGANTWAWNTTGLAPGVYGVGVWARQAGSSAAYEAYWIGTFTLSVATCTAAALSTVTASPQAPGAMITFSAVATRCPSAQFRFWMIPYGGVWTMQRDYGVNTWTWNTTGLVPGIYQLGVWARQPGSTDAYDAYGFTTFAIGIGNCISAGISPNLAPPQAPGATVMFTATSNSCTSPLYQFWLLRPGYSWQVRQPYSAMATWSWDTNTWPLGTYQVGVWVKASASSAAYDSFFIGTFQLDIGPCTSAGISASPASPQAPGATITFTATSTDCATPTYEFWRLPPPGSAWSVAQPYSGIATLSWNTTGLTPGPYRIGVWASQSGSAATYDSYAILTFWVGS